MWFVKSCLVFIIWKWSDASVGLFIPTVGLFLELFSWHQSVTTITMGPTVQSIAAEKVALFQFWFSR